MTRAETLSKLKQVVESAKGAPKLVEDIKETKEALTEAVEVSSNDATIQNIETETPQQEVVEPVISQAKPEPQSVSLFDELNQQTEEDSKPQNDKSKVEKLAENFTEEVDEEELDEEQDSPAFRKEMANIQATGIVEFADLIICLLCMAISGDWSKDAQEKKYTLTANRKKVLVVSIMRILIAKKSKPSPVKSIVMVALASFIPMIALAIMARRNKKAEEQKLKEYQKQQAEYEARLFEIQQASARLQTYEHNQPTLVNQPAIKKQTTKPAKTAAKGKQGRHKKGCNYYNGKPCNCK